VSRDHAAGYIEQLTKDRPHIIGAVPSFDTERLSLLLERHGCAWGGHYHLIDVENLAVGYLAHTVRTVDYYRTVLDATEDAEQHAASAREKVAELAGLITPPWDSDEISRAVGVEPPGPGVRHSAMGDARWALAIWDAITGGCGVQDVPEEAKADA
jgi:hypothetical protein